LVGVRAGIASARAAVYRGARPAPQRGLEMLRHWLSAARRFEYEAWILGDMAKYLALSGDAESGLQLAQRACAVAAHSGHTYEVVLRELDAAQTLLWAGRPEPALAVMGQILGGLESDHEVVRLLLQAEASLMLGESSTAHDRLQSALQIIEAQALSHLRPRAEALLQRL